MSSSVANKSDNLPGISISGGTVVLREHIEGSLTVKVYIDGRKLFQKETKRRLNDDPNVQWESNPPLILKHGSYLTIKLTERKSFHLTRKVCVEASVSFDDCQRLISSCPGELKEVKLQDDPTVVINIVARSPSTLQVILDDAVKVSEQTKPVLDRLGSGKEFLQTIMNLGGIASEAHPIAKALFSCVNIVYEKLQNQEQFNQLVVDLANDMACTLGYIEDVGQFARLAQLKQAIKDVTPLMEDTTNFIIEFTHQGQIRSLLSPDNQDKINELTEGFNRFKQQFDRGVSVQSAGSLEMLLKDMESTKDDKWLGELKPEGAVRGRPTAECMDGTREDVIAEIDKWCEDLDAPHNILWVSGSPGVGKSAISRKLAAILKSSHRFGSSFFLQRELASVQTPANLWRAIAYDLARDYPSARSVIIAKLKDGEIDLGNADARELFGSLVEVPLKHSTDIPSGRLPVIVIDAVDECGGLDGSRSKNRNVLLQGIKGWTRLGPRFKLIITSRPEHDISRALSTISHHIELGSGQNVSLSSSHDIHSFLSREFTRIADNYPALSVGWPGESMIEEFTKRSAGLFIYADTLIKFVDEGQPREQLERIFSEPLHHESLTQLYRQILDVSFKKPSSSVLQAFRNVTGTIILAKIPLRQQDIIHLLNLEDVELDHICQGLQSVLDHGDILRFTHQSFVDFLIDSTECPLSFLFDKAIQLQTLLLGSLHVMKHELKFNICKLETSHAMHDDIPSIETLVHANISMHLQYACVFWTDHINGCAFDVQIAEAVEIFMTSQFLYWLEVMSLLGKVNRVTHGLRSVMKWSKIHNNKITNFMADAAKFVTAFATPISQSVPHIYLSAIAFAPEKSIVGETFHGKYMNTLSVYRGKAMDWPVIQNVLAGSSEVECVAFSPDGSCIVAGLKDNNIHLWDAETGCTIGKPLEGHSGYVSSVAFSPDGSCIVSGSGDRTIRLWDAETGDPIGKPFEGHSGGVTAVAFSSDGFHIVSGSWDNNIYLWDAETGHAIGRPLEGHSECVTSVVFSPDGSHIVSGSYDNTICLWDAKAGVLIGKPFEGHSWLVTSVAFSPDGSRIVSGSKDSSIRLWDAETGVPIGKPFEGHSICVTSVAFSPDGSHIASGSWDKTIHLWDAQTGDLISKPFEGHSNLITSVAFSPDGSHIVSGSEDRTICIWDAEACNPIGKPFEGHSKYVTCVAFSPDGSHIVSSSGDMTLRLWDAKTGDPTCKPFQEHSIWITCVAFSPDGSHIVFGSGNNSICLLDAKGVLVGKPFEGHSAWITSVGFSPDGSRIMSGSGDKTIRLWSVETGDPIGKPFEGHSASVDSVAFSPDGSYIVSGGGMTIYLWDVETGDVVGKPFKGHSGIVTSVAFSPDGSHIVSGSGDRTIRLWSAETGDPIGKPFEGHSKWVTCVAFSPDGSWIVSGSYDKTICLWDAGTGDPIGKPFEGHSDWVTSVAFSPDGSRIVSGSQDTTIRLWDVEIGDPISKSFVGQSESVTSVAFLPDGSHIVPGSWDNSTTSNVVSLLNCAGYCQLLPSGWVVNSDAENLFWVPPWNRLTLCLNRTTMILSQHGEPTLLDMSHFVHGMAWEQCKTD